MKKLWNYFKPYRKEEILAPLFKLFEAVFELLVPVVVSKIVDVGLGEWTEGGYPNADKTFIFACCGVLCAFAVAGWIFAVIAQYYAAKTATGVASELRKSLFDKIQSLPFGKLDELGTSTLLTRITGDVSSLEKGVNMFLRLLLRSPMIVFGAVVTALFIDVQCGLIFLASVPILFLVVFLVMKFSVPAFRSSQEKMDEVTTSVKENLSGVRVIRAFCAEDKEREIFAERSKGLSKERTRASVLSQSLNPITFTIVHLCVVALLYVGGIRVDGGELTQGAVIALYGLFSQILVELIKLANLIVTVSKGIASGKRIEAVFETESEKDGGEEIEKIDSVEFRKVGIRYHEGGELALSGIDFCVRRGETLGVIGGTGSGKSSLLFLLSGAYPASEGEVLLSGKEIGAFSLASLRRRIAVVMQSPTLFRGTLRDNLLFGNPNATDEELFRALLAAQADGFVKERGGLSVAVEQGGRNFSGGQRQRLAIARALVKNADVLLLDDSSSALDYLTDSNLKKALKNLPTKPLTVLTSERISSVRGADRILVLDDGKAVGYGTHDELLKSCKVYREIYDLQYPNGEGEKV